MSPSRTARTRMRSLVTSAAVITALALPAVMSVSSADAAPSGEERVEAGLGENYILGFQWPEANGDVKVTVYDEPGGTELTTFTKSPTDDWESAGLPNEGSFLIDRFELGAVHLAPGMAIVATDDDGSPAVTKTLVVADLAMTSADPTTDIVTGVAPVDAAGRVSVDVDISERGLTSTTSNAPADPSDGTWSLDTSPFGIGVDSQLLFRVEEFDAGSTGGADGDATLAHRPPRIGIAMERGVGGDRWFIESDMLLEVFSDPSDLAGSLVSEFQLTPSADGTFFAPLDVFFTPVELEPGMAVRATDLTDTSNTKLHVIDDAAVVDIDLQSNTLRGVAPANVEVEAVGHADSGEVRMKTTTDANGNWSATFTEALTEDPNSHVVVSEYDATGVGGVDLDVTVHYFTPPTYTGLDPFRIVDTREAPGINTGPFDTPWGADQTRSIKVTGGEVPDDASAVAINITAVRPSAASFLTVHPTGSDQPTAASLNFAAGAVRNDMIIAKVGDGGMIDVYNASGDVDLVIDVDGYFAAYDGDGYEGLDPARIIDTRSDASLNTGPFSTPWGPDETRSISVAEHGVPERASAVVLNITAVRPSALSFLTVHPTGSDRPTAASLNFAPGVVRNDVAIAKVGDGAMVDIYNASGNVDLVIDIAGHFSDDVFRGYDPLTPFRLIDTRPNPALNTGPFNTPWGADETRSVKVTGDAVPEEASAVVLNITAVRPTELSFLTAFTTDAPMPTAASLNFASGVVRNDVVVAKVGNGGMVEIYNASGNVDLVVDVNGYFTADEGP